MYTIYIHIFFLNIYTHIYICTYIYIHIYVYTVYMYVNIYICMGYAIDAGFKQLKICDSTWLNARISPKGSDQRRKPQILLSLFVHRWGFGKQTTKSWS